MVARNSFDLCHIYLIGQSFGRLNGARSATIWKTVSASRVWSLCCDSSKPEFFHHEGHSAFSENIFLAKDWIAFNRRALMRAVQRLVFWERCSSKSLLDVWHHHGDALDLEDFGRCLDLCSYFVLWYRLFRMASLWLLWWGCLGRMVSIYRRREPKHWARTLMWSHHAVAN